MALDISSTVQTYKSTTASVVRWLAQNGGPSDGRHGCTHFSLEEIKTFAERVQRKEIQIPGHVYRAFQETIDTRRLISTYFKRAPKSTGDFDEKTISHEHFTEVLQSIFKTLRESGRKKRVGQSSSTRSQLNEPPEHFPPNKFAVLEYTALEKDVECLDIEESPPDEEPYAPSFPSARLSDVDYRIEGDSMSVLSGTFVFILELDSVCSVVKKCWDDVAAGFTPIVAEAWLSNAALHAVQRVVVGFRKSHPELPLSDHRNLVDHWSAHPFVLDKTLRPCLDIAPEYDIFMTGPGLSRPWRCLLEWKDKKYKSPPTTTERPARAPDESPLSAQKVAEGDKAEREIMRIDSLLNSIQLLLKSHEERYGGLDSSMNPLLNETREFLEADGETVDTALVFGLQLLTETSDSYKGVRSTAARLHALKFACEVRSFVTSVISHPNLECSCIDCEKDVLVLNLMALEDDLSKYVGEKCFDEYYNAPWVGGSHVIEILSWATDFGLRLCNLEGYVGAVLHIYNLLRQLKMLEETRPLEALRDLMGDAVFLGDLPSFKYHSRFLRFLGGKLDFNHRTRKAGKRKGKADQQHSRHPTWRLKLPEHATLDNITRRLIPEKLSLFYRIDKQRYGIDDDSWSQIYSVETEDGAGSRGTSMNATEVSRILDAGQLFEKIKIAAQSEFKGELPMAKINHFSIYLLCVKILENMAFGSPHFTDDMSKAGEKSTTGAAAKYGFTFVETLLNAVDEYQEDKYKSKLLPRLASLRISKDSIISATEGKTASHFLWTV